MATYLASSALDDLQAELKDHLLADAGGRCITCRVAEPCRRRNQLQQTLLNYGQLPKRQPGLTLAPKRQSDEPLPAKPLAYFGRAHQ